MSIGDYLKQHPEYLLANEENDQQQQTLWDRSLYANRDLSYPVENQPVPLMKLHLERERKERRRPKSRGRERRQIAPGMLLYIIICTSYVYLLVCLFVCLFIFCRELLFAFCQ